MIAPPPHHRDPVSQRSEIAAILAAGILRLDWRHRRSSVGNPQNLSVYSQNPLDHCSEIGPPVPPLVDTTESTQKGGDQ